MVSLLLCSVEDDEDGPGSSLNRDLFCSSLLNLIKESPQMIPPKHRYRLSYFAFKMCANNLLLFIDPLLFDDGEQRFTFHSLFLF